MQKEQVIKLASENNPQEGWAVFKANKSTLIIKFVVSLLLIAAILTTRNAYTNGGIFLIALVAIFIYLLFTIRNSFYIKTNILVLTNDSIVKSWNNKITEVKYSNISNLRSLTSTSYNNQIIPIIPGTCIDMIDISTNKSVRIGEKEDYQDIKEVFTMLLNRIT